jgi:3-hydroxymyristoyl/3-hydroxydecanoyl-(acyl carrier protein) dehydratase
MEIALQPCGWLAMYAGTVLHSPKDLLFRNLDGTCAVRREVTGATRLRTHVRLTALSRLDDVTIESFEVSCAVAGGPDDGRPVFEAGTRFGFFPPEAFANQPGMPPSERDLADLHRPGLTVPQPAGGTPAGPRFGPLLTILDEVTGFWPDAGAAGLGRLRARKAVDAGQWYFRAHFFQDPVQPGSLGVQAMCQLLQWYLVECGLTAALDTGGREPWFEPVRVGEPVRWRYRGQVVPADRLVTVELEITGRGGDRYSCHATADGWLWVDGRRIYHVSGLAARVRTAR